MKARLEATRHQCRRRHRSWFRQVDLFLRSNGIRLEFTAEIVGQDELKEYARNAHAALAAWTKDKAASSRAAARPDVFLSFSDSH